MLLWCIYLTVNVFKPLTVMFWNLFYKWVLMPLTQPNVVVHCSIFFNRLVHEISLAVNQLFYLFIHHYMLKGNGLKAESFNSYPEEWLTVQLFLLEGFKQKMKKGLQRRKYPFLCLVQEMCQFPFIGLKLHKVCKENTAEEIICTWRFAEWDGLTHKQAGFIICSHKAHLQRQGETCAFYTR